MTPRRALLSLLLLALTGSLAAAEEFFFRPTDRVIVFHGDSITEQRRYTTYLEAYLLCRFPDWQVQIRNTGIGGDTSWGRKRNDSLEVGINRDVLPLKPAAVTIMLGMNDLRAGAEALDRYRECMARQTELLQAAGVRVALLTSSPEQRRRYGVPAGSPNNPLLWRFSQAEQEAARARQVPWVNVFTPFVKLLERAQAEVDPDFVLVPDYIHPNWAGHLNMAHAILTTLHAPALISDAWLDAASATVVRTRACTVSDVQARDGALCFTRADAAGPMAIHPESYSVLAVPGYATELARDLNYYALRVTGLPAPRYEVAVAGHPLARFTREQLAGGVNLPTVGSPLEARALQLMYLVIEKNDLYWERWHNTQIVEVPADQQAAQDRKLADLDARIADLEARINALRQPAPLQFTLSPG